MLLKTLNRQLEQHLNKDNDFQNVIYEVQDGEFAEQINQISDGYGEVLNL